MKIKKGKSPSTSKNVSGKAVENDLQKKKKERKEVLLKNLPMCQRQQLEDNDNQCPIVKDLLEYSHEEKWLKCATTCDK